MRRLTAQLVLLFALLGNSAPIALAATAQPPHACCVRKAVHPCHGAALSKSDQPVVRDASCCNHNCCRALTVTQRAQPLALVAASFTLVSETHVGQSQPVFSNVGVFGFESTRAPPIR